MFKFLKEKIKATVDKFTKKEETSVEEEIQETQESMPAADETAVKETSSLSVAQESSSEKEHVARSAGKVQEEEKNVHDTSSPLSSSAEESLQEELASVAEEEKTLAKEVAAFDESLEETAEALQQEVKTEAVVEELLEEQPKLQEQQQEQEKQQKEAKEAELKKDEEGKATEQKAEQQLKEQEKEQETKPQKKSFFKRLTEGFTKTTITEEKFEEFFWELEIGLLESNVAVEVIEKIKDDLKQALVGKTFTTKQLASVIYEQLRASLDEILSFPVPNLLELIKQAEKPYVILFVGINGTGKTTTIAKFVYYLQKHGLSAVVAAADTFRAAAIDQLKEHTDKLGVKLIKHDYGADPAAVGYDAVQYAKAKGIDVVLIDTAGRMHANVNLMDELKKIIRVTQPNLKLFVGDALTGNDCIEQAKEFQEAGAIDGLILSKVDADDKGGTVLSVAYVTKKPVFFLGIGQGYDDLVVFDKTLILERLGFS